MFWLFLILVLIAAAFLLPQEPLKKAGLSLPDQSHRKHVWQVVLFLSLMLLMLSLRLVPFAIIIFFVGLGVIGNSLWQEYAQQGNDLHDKEIPPRAPPILSGRMTLDEAWDVLGLEPGASIEDIDAAYRRLMGQIHPDKGGTDYLAAKINEARDLLKKQQS